MKNKERQWLPTFAELIDRTSIHQLKEVFIPEHKQKYAEELAAMEHDMDLLIEQKDIKLSGKMLRAIIVTAQINAHIWYNESKVRSGESQDLTLLKLTHGLNGLRNASNNLVMDLVDETSRKDYKTDCLAAEFKDWKMSLLSDDDES